MNTFYTILICVIAWPVIIKLLFSKGVPWQQTLIHSGALALVATALWFIGIGGSMNRTEIISGEVISKSRVQDDYVDTYDCGCVDFDGFEVCSTCSDKHYTVDWTIRTTVGEIVLPGEDSLYESVQSDPDPQAYSLAEKGMPAAREHSYENYLAHQYAYHPLRKTLKEYRVPEYPRVYDRYQIKRVLTVGADVTAEEMDHLNYMLGDALRTLGASKQVNVIVVLTDYPSEDYAKIVEVAWDGANKNDVIVFAGLLERKLSWVEVYTWSQTAQNGSFVEELKYGLLKQKSFDAELFGNKIITSVEEYYKRPEMATFANQKASVLPSTGYQVFLGIFLLLCSIGGSFFLDAQTKNTQRYGRYG